MRSTTPIVLPGADCLLSGQTGRTTGGRRFAHYHVQEFSEKDGGSDSKLIVVAGNNFHKTLG